MACNDGGLLYCMENEFKKMGKSSKVQSTCTCISKIFLLSLENHAIKLLISILKI